jgi:hypothetical protein
MLSKTVSHGPYRAWLMLSSACTMLAATSMDNRMTCSYAARTKLQRDYVVCTLKVQPGAP